MNESLAVRTNRMATSISTNTNRAQSMIPKGDNDLAIKQVLFGVIEMLGLLAVTIAEFADRFPKKD